MVAAITARSGSGTVVEAKTAVHIEVTGLGDNVESVSLAVEDVSIANPSVVSTTEAHGYVDGETVLLAGLGTTPDVNGAHVVTVVDANNFSIPVNVTATTDVAGTARKTLNSAGQAMGTERRYYILVDAPVGVDDGRSHVFTPSGDGKHTWDGYIFPADGNYTLRLRDMLDDSDVATAAVVVAAA